MPPTPFRPTAFIRDLKRRHVFRVAGVYAVVAWVLVEIADTIFPHLALPAWSVTLVVVLLVLGFPVAVLLAWAFELTPDGVRRTGSDAASSAPVAAGDQAPVSIPPRVAFVALGLTLALALVLLGSRILFPERSGAGQSGEAAVATSATADGHTASLAVLPFANLGGEETRDFTEGVAEDIRTQLGRLAALRVIGRTSVMRYTGVESGAREIGVELGISHVLEGSVQRSGNRLRIIVRLVSAASGEQLWSERYDRDGAADIFAIQTDVAEQVALALLRQLSPTDRDRIGALPAADLRAYELHLAARALLVRRDMAGVRRAAELFQKAIELDSTYAPAYVGLADAYILMSSWAAVSSRELAGPAREAANRAIALAPQLGEAWTSLAYIHAWFEREWVHAEELFQRAIDLNPNYATAHHWYAVLLSQLGRLDEAKLHIERAQSLDPASPIIHTIAGLRYHFARDYENAVAQHRRSLDLQDDYPVGYLWLAQAYAAQGRLEEALQHYRHAAELDAESPVTQSGLAYGLALTGDTAAARGILKKIDARSGPDYTPRHYWVAQAYVGLGDHDAAFAALKLGLLHDGFLGNLLMEPLMDPLRGDPRYDRVIAELRFPGNP